MKNSFATVHPELVCEWSEKNLPLTPDSVGYGSNKLVWWKAECGHEWLASPKSRSAGEKCPICSGKRVVEGINDLQTLRPDLAAQWSPANGSLKPTMVALYSHKKVIWRDKLGHEWSAIVKSRTQGGTDCPYCSHNKVLAGFNDLESCFPEVATEWSERNLPLLPSMVLAFTNQKVWWECEKGHEWIARVADRSGGSGCPYCGGAKVLKGFNDLTTKHPAIAAEWSERNFPLTPDTITEKSCRNVWWHCSTCGTEWQGVIKSRVKGRICPVCAERAVKAGFNDLQTTDPTIAAEWNFERNKGLCPTSVSRYSLRFVWWRDEFGHEWRDRIVNRAVDGAWCRECERAFRSALPGLLISLFARREETELVLNSATLLGIPLDAYIPELRLAIDTQSIGKKEADLKRYLCGKRKIAYVQVVMSDKSDLTEYAHKIVLAFQKAHAFIRIDEESLVAELRRRFRIWQGEGKALEIS